VYYQGYDGLPIESMQGLDINSSSNFDQSDLKNDQSYVNYNPTDDESPYVNTIITTQQRSLNQNELLPNPPPPSESNQVAAWYDTDL